MNVNYIITLKNIIKFLFIVLTMISFYKSYATVLPRSIGNENRIKIINYKPNHVFKFIGHYTYQSIIEFSLDEEIQTITMGTPTPWQIITSGNRIFLKPVEDDASTNMTVITNKRMYFFEMHAEEADNMQDDSLAFIVKFVYPDDGVYSSFASSSSSNINSRIKKSIDTHQGPDLTDLSLYNFNYKVSGKKSIIEPLQVFDDGEFTYFKFRDINADVPAIFLVHDDNTEALINYRIAGRYVIVERVASRFTLRYGKSFICVFNESFDDMD